jgi:hypothetical protein
MLLLFPVASQSSLFLISRETIISKAWLISDSGWKIRSTCLCAAITSLEEQNHAKVHSHSTAPNLRNNIALWRVPKIHRLSFLWHGCAGESEQEHWWNDKTKKKPKYSETKLSHCQFVNQQSPTDGPKIEPFPRTDRLSHSKAFKG